MLEEKIMERQFKAIQRTGKDMKTLNFVKGGYQYFGNGFQLVKVATWQADRNIEQFKVAEAIFEDVKKYEDSVDIDIDDLYHIFKGLKSGNLCEHGVTLDFDGGGNLTIKNYLNKFDTKIKIGMNYKGDETKYNVLLSVDKVFIILNALRSLNGQNNVRMFFDPLDNLKPVMFYDVFDKYEVVQSVMRKF